MNASILVVEDNADNMKLITWLLEDEGYSFRAVGSAEEALDLVETQTFDLVLMDISLPGMDGMEATRCLRAKPGFENIPVIAVTANAIRGAAEKILSAGVSALVTKPIDEDDLLSTIRSFLFREAFHGESARR